MSYVNSVEVCRGLSRVCRASVEFYVEVSRPGLWELPVEPFEPVEPPVRPSSRLSRPSFGGRGPSIHPALQTLGPPALDQLASFAGSCPSRWCRSFRPRAESATPSRPSRAWPGGRPAFCGRHRLQYPRQWSFDCHSHLRRSHRRRSGRGCCAAAGGVADYSSHLARRRHQVPAQAARTRASHQHPCA